MLILTLIALFVVGSECVIPRWGRNSAEYAEKHDSRAGEYLLPTNLEPLEYDISIIPYLEYPPENAFTFDGHVNIVFNVIADTTIVRLHAFNLNISGDTLKVQATNETEARNISSWGLSTDDKQFFSIYMTKALEANRSFTLDVDFNGWMKDDLVGFYRSSYFNDTGDTNWLGVTFFEAPYARQAFPCWDEPGYRANFTLHVAHAPGQLALSNMPTSGPDTPIENRPELVNWMWTHFEPSVSMATYLVAFAVSEFKSLEITDNTITHRTWARPGIESQGQYGLDVSPRTISYMEEFTNQPYPLAKMDHIALPDFIAGAMENWGIITYRETALLIEDGVSSTANRQRVATVVAHEVAHQWFGNLVTPKWWNNIWLNEAFATYFEYHMMGALEPTWGLEQQFMYDEMYSSLLSDAFETTHAVIDTVENPAGPEAVFDGLAYTKGGPIVRFLANLMGLEHFKFGIWDYMAKNAYGNADAEDLWASLEIFVQPGILPQDTTLGKVMNTWLKQPGYPVLNVTRDYDDSTRIATISQQRFVLYPSGTLPLDETWLIPLTLTSLYDINFTNLSLAGWLEGPETTLQLQATADQWILLNVQEIGFYRVNYDARNWAMLISALKVPLIRAQFHPVNRGQLMDDALTLARAAYLDYTTALDTTGYLVDEVDYAPWAAALNAFSFLYDRFNYDDYARGLLEWYVLQQMQLVYADVGGVTEGTTDEEHLHKILRMLVLRWACDMGHPQCNDDAKALYDLWIQETYPDRTNPIDPDLRYVSYCAGMRAGGQADYDFLFSRYGNASKYAGEQEVLMKSLACASNTYLLEQLLLESIAPNSVFRYQDAKSVYSLVYGNRYGVDIALDFLIAYYREAALAYGGMGTVGGLFAGLATKLNTQEQRNKLESFRTDNQAELGDALGGVDAALVTLDQNMQWHRDYRAEVIQYLENLQGPSGSAISLTSSLMSTVLLSTFLLYNVY